MVCSPGEKSCSGKLGDFKDHLLQAQERSVVAEKDLVLVDTKFTVSQQYALWQNRHWELHETEHFQQAEGSGTYPLVTWSLGPHAGLPSTRKTLKVWTEFSKGPQRWWSNGRRTRGNGHRVKCKKSHLNTRKGCCVSFFFQEGCWTLGQVAQRTWSLHPWTYSKPQQDIGLCNAADTSWPGSLD